MENNMNLLNENAWMEICKTLGNLSEEEKKKRAKEIRKDCITNPVLIEDLVNMECAFWQLQAMYIDLKLKCDNLEIANEFLRFKNEIFAA